MLLEVNVWGPNTAEGAVRVHIAIKWTSDYQVDAEGQPIRFVCCTFITGLQRFEIRGETSADLRQKDEMNTRKDDGPTATDDDDDDEMWGNVKNISSDLTNGEVDVINATNFKFLFAGKHNPVYIHATRLHSRISVTFCFSICIYSRILKQIFAD